MRAERLRWTDAVSFWGLVLLLTFSTLSGCASLPGRQVNISGTVLGESATAREAGRVVAAVVTDATVTCDGTAASTSPDGSFQLSLSASDQYTCSVSAPSYLTLSATLAGVSGDTLRVTFSSMTRASCASSGSAAFLCAARRLAPGTLTGIVTNSQTDSVATKTQVECWDLDQTNWGGEPLPPYITTTDQSGRYTLTLPVDPFDCVVNNNDPLYHVAVAPATTTSADMATCDPHCPAFSYHSGDVMHSFTAYVIFWLPPGATYEPGNNNRRFESLIQRYFRDAGGTLFFAILTQYWDKNGPINGPATLGGTYMDTTPYPHKGTVADPLHDADIHDAIQRAMQAKGWIDYATNEFFVITGYGIQECESGRPGAPCTYSGGERGYCGYHGSLRLYDPTYAYIADTSRCAVLPYYDQYPSPNHDAVADGELSTISHEMFESISDPYGDGWFEANPDTGEMGDKCVTDYGTIRSDGSNVTLSGHPYILQAEWSNAAGGCAFSYKPSP